MNHPAVDALTANAMVVFQDRPVVPFTKWLAAALRACSQTRRGLQIVTPVGSRITMPLRLVLTAPNSRWVVRSDGGYYDGLIGVPLRWDGAAFVVEPQARSYAPAFTTPPTHSVGAQLTVTFRVRHMPDTVIGGAAELMCRSLTGEPPSGWGTSEPITRLWQQANLDELARYGGSEPIWLTFIGGVSGLPAIGSMLLSRVGGAIEEAVTLVVGYAEPSGTPVSNIPAIAGSLAAEYPLMSFFAQLSAGFTDLTIGPRWVGPAAPIGMAVSGTAAGPPGIAAQQIGQPQSPTVWFTLGDGWQQDGWQRYEQLTGHLGAQMQ